MPVTFPPAIANFGSSMPAARGAPASRADPGNWNTFADLMEIQVLKLEQVD